VTAVTLGLVVVGFGSTDEWEEFFDSISMSTLRPEAIVVVENSPDVPLLPAHTSLHNVSVIHRPDNPGYGTAANTGVAALPDAIDVVVVCNPDVRLTLNALERMVTTLESRPDVGLLGPQIVTSHGDVYPSARAFPGIRIGIGHALFGTLWPGNPWTSRYLGNLDSDTPQVVGWVSGSLFMARRSAFEAVHGFDERFFMFFEDVDLAFRMKRAGWRCLYEPRASITHSGAHATGKNMSFMVRQHHRSAELFMANLYPHWYQWPLRLVLRGGLRLRSLLLTGWSGGDKGPSTSTGS
jgi:N-acetylglucosaminyl-diphospho-decaprenol L-rhamnosyltransferase